MQFLQQHRCKTSSLAMLRVWPATDQTCLATNEDVALQKFLQKVEKFYSNCDRICTCCAFYLPNANLTTSLHEVTHIHRLARLPRNFIQSEVGIHVAKQVARSCRPLYFSFNMIWPGAWVPRFDLTKCAFVVSLLVFKRDYLLKNLVGSSA